MKPATLVIAMISVNSAAYAGSGTTFMGTGNDVLTLCTAPQGLTGCIAYISGVADAMAGDNAVWDRKACIPSGVTTGQLRDIVVTGLRFRAAIRHLQAGITVATLFADAFPCAGPR